MIQHSILCTHEYHFCRVLIVVMYSYEFCRCLLESYRPADRPARLLQEQLRSCVCHGGAYGHEVADWFEVSALAFCAALTLEDNSRAGASSALSARLARQFAAVVLQPPSADETRSIFARRLGLSLFCTVLVQLHVRIYSYYCTVLYCIRVLFPFVHRKYMLFADVTRPSTCD